MPLGGCNIVAQTQLLLPKRLSRPTTACARTGVSIRHRTHSTLSPQPPFACGTLSLSLPQHTCSYRPQQMQMSLSCVIRGNRSLTSPWSALPAYLSQQQQQISTFSFRGEFLINRLVAVLLASKTEPAPPLSLSMAPPWLCRAARDTHLQAVYRQQGRGSPLNQMF